VEILYPTDEELINNFGGCNLIDIKKKLRDAEVMVEKIREEKIKAFHRR
jgi:ligand-binding sensor protein